MLRNWTETRRKVGETLNRPRMRLKGFDLRRTEKDKPICSYHSAGTMKMSEYCGMVSILLALSFTFIYIHCEIVIQCYSHVIWYPLHDDRWTPLNLLVSCCVDSKGRPVSSIIFRQQFTVCRTELKTMKPFYVRAFIRVFFLHKIKEHAKHRSLSKAERQFFK